MSEIQRLRSLLYEARNELWVLASKTEDPFPYAWPSYSLMQTAIAHKELVGRIDAALAKEPATESVIEWKGGSNGVVATPTGSVTLQTWTATLDTVGVSVREVVPGRYCYELVPLVYRTAEEAKAAALEAATRGASPGPFRATHPVYIEKR